LLAVDVKNVRTGLPKLVETVTYAGVTPLSDTVTVVPPQIEEVELDPYKSFYESLKNG
jgi:hypothetical protein